ncbi:M56 family metallopeptidase [Neptunitalea lumnitzerae]|uniref:TonB C-terminal domain-containing protein n=1 Tax=Neptunitalea lumnitzerae TaxID=2965509 RepID=A0ABQ5MGG0_9FLAO|nr:M56 family metallopeptidase [Neptunitalea sp. Y10]GLB48474.1 hypothetical protein Y10_08420 [Neptunitalea sp. Y10]
MVQYLILAVTCQALFLAIYDVFLKKATFFNYNRAYVLLSSLVSLLLPLLRVPTFEKLIPKQYTIPRISIYNTDTLINLEAVTVTAHTNTAWYEQFHWSFWLFVTGSAISFILFLIKLYKIESIRNRGKHILHGNYIEVIVPNSTVAFSFFNLMFLGDQLKEKQHSHILLHEMVHIQQKHSWDLVYFELLKIVLWFNPFIYIYQKRITELHEYIADEKSSTNGKKQQYQLLLAEAFQTENIAFVNQFFNHSLIKKRIIMLQKSKSRKTALLKYLTVVPLLIFITVYVSSCNQYESSSLETPITNAKIEYYGTNIDYHVGDLKNLTDEEKATQQKLINSLSEDGYTTLTLIDDFSARTVLELEDSGVSTNEPDVPFTVVYKKPMFKECESAVDASECFKEMLHKHVMNTFHYPEEALAKKVQGRVYILFRINTKGKVEVLSKRGPDKSLEAEASRIIKSLPTFMPAEDENGDPVNVTFAYPIVFKLS